MYSTRSDLFWSACHVTCSFECFVLSRPRNKPCRTEDRTFMEKHTHSMRLCISQVQRGPISSEVTLCLVMSSGCSWVEHPQCRLLGKDRSGYSSQALSLAFAGHSATKILGHVAWVWLSLNPWSCLQPVISLNSAQAQIWMSFGGRNV